MGADPTTSRVTGECSTVELQPHFFSKKRCRGWGSNPRPWAYESHALPTELPRQNLVPTPTIRLSLKLNKGKVKLVAGCGIAPQFQGYEPYDLLLVQPAILNLIISQVIKLFKYLLVKTDRHLRFSSRENITSFVGNSISHLMRFPGVI